MNEHQANETQEWLTNANIAARLKRPPPCVNQRMRRGMPPKLKTWGQARPYPEAPITGRELEPCFKAKTEIMGKPIS